MLSICLCSVSDITEKFSNLSIFVVGDLDLRLFDLLHIHVDLAVQIYADTLDVVPLSLFNQKVDEPLLLLFNVHWVRISSHGSWRGWAETKEVTKNVGDLLLLLKLSL